MNRISNYSKVIKYLLTGGLAFVIDYLLLIVCFYVLSLPLWTATTLGYLGGLCVSFFINRTWVFGMNGKQRKMTRQLVEYVILLLFNYVFTVFAIRISDSIGITPAISKIVITILIAFWNYIIFNKVIFSQNKDKLSP